jgi:hypothetical protein
MIYYKEGKNNLTESANFSTFYLRLLKVVRDNWKRTGNSVLGLTDSKVSRLFSGKQKDFETLLGMAEFMGIDFRFVAF